MESRNKITGLVIAERYHAVVTKWIPEEELTKWEVDVRADDAADFSPSADDLYTIRAIGEIRMWREAARDLMTAWDSGDGDSLEGAVRHIALNLKNA